jgi:hypothetical protein
LAKSSGQFRQSDVARWGIIALATCALAVVASNVSSLLPPAMLAGLHKTRLGGASVEQLRGQVAELRAQTQQLQRDNATLITRLALGEKQSGDTAQRVGALEVSLPNFLESYPGQAGVDYAARTAAIGDGGTQSFAADGGTIKIRRAPLRGTGTQEQAALAAQPIPTPLDPPGGEFGIAIGPALAEGEAVTMWNDLSAKLGPLLLGMAPLLHQDAGSDKQRLVVGPLAQMADATALCGRLERVSIACTPMSFSGIALKH